MTVYGMADRVRPYRKVFAAVVTWIVPEIYSNKQYNRPYLLTHLLHGAESFLRS